MLPRLSHNVVAHPALQSSFILLIYILRVVSGLGKLIIAIMGIIRSSSITFVTRKGEYTSAYNHNFSLELFYGLQDYLSRDLASLELRLIQI